MDLFSNKIVAGLFDNQEDLGQALSDLRKQGFGKEKDDLVLIDKEHLAGESPFLHQGKQYVAFPTATSSAGVGAVLNNEISPEDSISEGALEEKLLDLGIDEKEVDFYTRQVKRGNTLLVIETGDDKAQQAHNIMRRFNAKSSIS